MNKRKAIAFTIFLFLLILILIFYIFSELYSEDDIEESITDSVKIKEEYESLNNTLNHQNVSINEKNPLIYKTAEDIVKEINNKENFIVYFGYADCSYCRSTIESFLKVAAEHQIKEIFYVNLKDIRDEYSLDENGNLVKTSEGDKNYMILLDKFKNVLKDYEPLEYTTKKGKTKLVYPEEKRIYAPTFIVVKNGNALSLTNGISDKQIDENTEVTDEIKKEQEALYKEFFSYYEVNKNTCNIESQAC